MNKQKVDLTPRCYTYLHICERKAMYILFNYRESLRPKISI